MNNQEIKDLLNFGSSVATLIDSVAKGVNLSEVGQVLKVIQQAPGALREAPLAFNEYLSLDDAGRADVEAYIATLFPLAEAHVAAAIKEVLDVVVSLSNVAALLKKPVGMAAKMEASN
jgi:hypothetical protein